MKLKKKAKISFDKWMYQTARYITFGWGYDSLALLCGNHHASRSRQ